MTELPQARVKRRHAWLRAAWIIPVVSAIVAGWLVYDRVRALGPEITIHFKDGGGLRVGQTPVKYRGVQIGEVSGVELSEDLKEVLVKARLRRSASPIAREGALFWIVRPEVGLGNVSGLSMVFTGPEIQALPGTGAARSTFRGLDSAPVALEAAGLKLILRTERVKSLKPNSPVYYRGVQVGVVQKIDLSPDAAGSDVQVLIWERYAPLVREGSAFWNASGASIRASLLKGLDIEIESLRALLVGGIEFATPGAELPRVKPGTVFHLHEAPRGEWLRWAPHIPLMGISAR